MAKFNLIEEINKILNEFDNVDMHDIKAILSWFYKAIYLGNMYEDADIAKRLLERLTSHGYETTISEEDYLHNVRTLIVESDPINEELIAKSLLSAIIRKLKNKEVLDENLNTFIRIYNERFNRTVTNRIMMESLKQCIGENIIYVCIKDEKFSLNNGVLDAVTDYQSISVNGENIPFIGYNIGIKTIHASDGKYLFNNPYLTVKSDLVELYSLEELKRKTFGKAYEDTKIVKF